MLDLNVVDERPLQAVLFLALGGHAFKFPVDVSRQTTPACLLPRRQLRVDSAGGVAGLSAAEEARFCFFDFLNQLLPFGLKSQFL